MKKGYSLLLVASLFIGATFAQQDAQFTQNMFNKLAVNPGYAGSNGGICGTLLSRQQWMGFEGNPKTNLLSVDALVLGKHGVGLTVFQDKLGAESNFNIKLAYAYHLQLGAGNLGLGLDVGFIRKSLTADWVAVDDYTLDPSIPNLASSDGAIDVGFGAYYTVPQKMYLGVSAMHLNSPQFVDKVSTNPATPGDLSFDQAMHLYVQAGYFWDFVPGKWQLQPSLFAKSDAASTQLDLNATVLYNNMVWGGVSYRLQDAIAVMAGLYVPKVEGLKVGVSYDVNTSRIGDYSNGGLEFMLGYCKTLTKPVKREVYKSVRFL